jgi:ATPase subunit of ABC transporter with duplicated ATPase domains
MTSEEPPSIRHTPLEPSTRFNSAPAGDLETSNMGSAAVGGSAPQVLGQDSGSERGEKDRPSAAIGQVDKHASEARGEAAKQDGAPTTAKVEPDSRASVPQDTVSTTSDEVSAERANSSLEKEDNAETAPASDPQQELGDITLDNIQKLIDVTDLDKLDAGVDESLAILDALQAPLRDSKQTKQSEWLATINKLKQQPKKSRTVVAVVGETGAGKTSLINALLGEDKMLVTSGWRACTAVICEISYNEMDDPQKAYRAEVEFIPQEDWDQELRLLFQDLVEDNRLLPEKSDSKTDAGIALAKLKAVYPDLTDSMIAQNTPRTLANRARVAEVLNTTHRFEYANSSDLGSALQKYVDSKEKSTKVGLKKEQDMAFWPLIKVVRIFCRAEALSTGLVVVDLPGVADSNPARSGIANKYMTECSAVWVAAPIKRATDNKTAKELMGKSSRLQMKLDGIYSNMTFICTMVSPILPSPASLFKISYVPSLLDL